MCHFLIQSSKSHFMQNFIKDMCIKKRKTNVPKKVLLATNISELLTGPIPVKYKD